MRKQLEEEGWQDFMALCSKVKSKEELRRLFELFFTLEEKETFGRRYLVVKALEKGELTQREIAEKFKVSISQITRGSNALKIIGSDLRKFLKTHMD